MIRYALRCANGHDFDSWFRSSDGYDAMRAAGQVSCGTCGSTKVQKALMGRGSDTAGAISVLSTSVDSHVVQATWPAARMAS